MYVLVATFELTKKKDFKKILNVLEKLNCLFKENICLMEIKDHVHYHLIYVSVCVCVTPKIMTTIYVCVCVCVSLVHDCLSFNSIKYSFDLASYVINIETDICEVTFTITSSKIIFTNLLCH